MTPTTPILYLQKPFKKLLLSCMEGIYFLSIEDIVYCEADCNYTKIRLVTGKTLMTSRCLKAIEKKLVGFGFFRVHQSYLINLQHIRKYYRNGLIEMEDDSLIKISQRRKESFLNSLLTV